MATMFSTYRSKGNFMYAKGGSKGGNKGGIKGGIKFMPKISIALNYNRN